MEEYLNVIDIVKDAYKSGDTKFFEKHLLNDGMDEYVFEQYSDSLDYLRALLFGRLFDDWVRGEESLDLKDFQFSKFKACIDDYKYLYVVYEDKVMRYGLHEFHLGVRKAEVEGVIGSFVIIGIHFTNGFFLSKIRMLYDDETNYFSLLCSSSDWDNPDGMVYEASQGKEFTGKDALSLKRKLILD